MMKEVNCTKDCIYIKSGTRILRLDLESINYVEAYGDYVKFFCNNRNKPLLSLCSLKRIEQLLPLSEFMRVHRSYIVRVKSINVLENGVIVFDKVRIPVGKSYQKIFAEFLNSLPIA